MEFLSIKPPEQKLLKLIQLSKQHISTKLWQVIDKKEVCN